MHVNLRQAVIALALATPVLAQSAESPAQHAARMAWWREARFGLFIHWGLYAVPAGEWGGKTNYGEWIRDSAKIPIGEYEKFLGQFNPVKFNADEWVKLATDAGMQYVVITSKHHDGFCLWDSKQTDWDVANTPFKRDILKELSEASKKGGLRFCTYHSIMDWHHPDYLPRRGWEEKDRPKGDANYDRFVQYLKAQLAEIVKGYDPGVLWFDGEWENTWTHERGVDLYHYVRGLKPDIIINNRVDVMRDGMAGFSKDKRAVGDYHTPEQEIPAAGFPGADWETCMTMNTHWGWNKNDRNWKSSETLVRMLIDIASKGGNFLLNIGPTAEGTFPPESISRLRDMGAWMKMHGEAIYGTQASPFKSLAWGRCTTKALDGGATRLYLHVFDWPTDGKLRLGGLLNDAKQSYLLSGGDKRPLDVKRDADALVVSVPPRAADPFATVIAIDIVGTPDIGEPPRITAENDIFVDELPLTIATDQKQVEIRFTVDGKDPTIESPNLAGALKLRETMTVKARSFRGDKAVSGVGSATFTKVKPRLAETTAGTAPGVHFEYYEGEWDKLPDFEKLKPTKAGTVTDFEFTPRNREEHFAFRYRGFVTIPRAGVYRFFTASDDGSCLAIGDQLVVDNNGLHGLSEKSGVIALDAGPQPITVTFFEKTGGDGLEVWWSGPGIEKQRVPKSALSR